MADQMPELSVRWQGTSWFKSDKILHNCRWQKFCLLLFLVVSEDRVEDQRSFSHRFYNVVTAAALTHKRLCTPVNGMLCFFSFSFLERKSLSLNLLVLYFSMLSAALNPTTKCGEHSFSWEYRDISHDQRSQRLRSTWSALKIRQMFEASFSFLSCCHGLRWAKSPKQNKKKKKRTGQATSTLALRRYRSHGSRLPLYRNALCTHDHWHPPH